MRSICRSSNGLPPELEDHLPARYAIGAPVELEQVGPPPAPASGDVVGKSLYIDTDVDWRLSANVSGTGPGQSFLRSGSKTQAIDAWDAIGGIRGQILLGSGSWFIPFYGDIGSGDSDFIWSFFSGIGYSFKNWFDGMIGYRHMEWDNDGDEFVQELILSGPILGARFNFQEALVTLQKIGGRTFDCKYKQKYVPGEYP